MSGLLLRLHHSGASAQAFWSAWSWEPTAGAGLLLTAGAYFSGVRSLWREAGARGLPGWRIWCFGTGLLIVALALFSPLAALAGSLLAAHMIQHLLLMLGAPPLLILGAPFRVIFWAIPSGARRSLALWWNRDRVLARLVSGAAKPAVAWTLSMIALLLWHLPGLYQAALAHESLHVLEHLCFVGTGLLFWQVVLRPNDYRRLNYGVSVLYLFTAALPSGLLGALLTFAGRPLYSTQSAGASLWGLTPLEDQQLAGLIMWMPGGLIYLGAAAGFFLAWLRSEEERGLRKATLLVGLLCLMPAAACAGADSEPPVTGGDPALGKQAIVAYGCGSCHIIPGIRQAHGLVGPPLTQFARRAFIAGEAPNTAASLIQWIQSPQSIEPGTAMPNLDVTKQQARNIAAYLYTLR